MPWKEIAVSKMFEVRIGQLAPTSIVGVGDGIGVSVGGIAVGGRGVGVSGRINLVAARQARVKKRSAVIER